MSVIKPLNASIILSIIQLTYQLGCHILTIYIFLHHFLLKPTSVIRPLSFFIILSIIRLPYKESIWCLPYFWPFTFFTSVNWHDWTTILYIFLSIILLPYQHDSWCLPYFWPSTFFTNANKHDQTLSFYYFIHNSIALQTKLLMLAIFWPSTFFYQCQ